MTVAELAEERKLAHDRAAASEVRGTATSAGSGASTGTLVPFFWLLVGIPLAWGVWTTVEKAAVLFK